MSTTPTKPNNKNTTNCEIKLTGMKYESEESVTDSVDIDFDILTKDGACNIS